MLVKDDDEPDHVPISEIIKANHLEKMEAQSGFMRPNSKQQFQNTGTDFSRSLRLQKQQESDPYSYINKRTNHFSEHQ